MRTNIIPQSDLHKCSYASLNRFARSQTSERSGYWSCASERSCSLSWTNHRNFSVNERWR